MTPILRDFFSEAAFLVLPLLNLSLVQDTRAHAEAAKESLDNKSVRGRTMRVRFAVHGASLRVKELSPYVSNELLFQVPPIQETPSEIAESTNAQLTLTLILQLCRVSPQPSTPKARTGALLRPSTDG